MFDYVKNLIKRKQWARKRGVPLPPPPALPMARRFSITTEKTSEVVPPVIPQCAFEVTHEELEAVDEPVPADMIASGSSSSDVDQTRPLDEAVAPQALEETTAPGTPQLTVALEQQQHVDFVGELGAYEPFKQGGGYGLPIEEDGSQNPLGLSKSLAALLKNRRKSTGSWTEQQIYEPGEVRLPPPKLPAAGF